MYHAVVTICTVRGHYMYRTVVTICTASLTFSSSTFCPHSVFVCFVWISEQTAIISLYSINWLVCITETVCVYCAVRTESLNTSRVTWFGRLGADILRLGPHRLCRTSPCEIYGAQSGIGTSSVLTAPFSPISVTQPMFHIIFLCKLLAADSQSVVRSRRNLKHSDILFAILERWTDQCSHLAFKLFYVCR